MVTSGHRPRAGRPGRAWARSQPVHPSQAQPRSRSAHPSRALAVTAGVTAVLLPALVLLGAPCPPAEASAGADTGAPAPAAGPVAAVAPAARGAESVTAARDSVRELTVTVLADSRFRKRSGWRDLARRAIRKAGEDLPRAVGIRLVPGEPAAWDPSSDRLRLAAILDEAAKTTDARGGLTAVFLGLRPGDEADRAERGYAILGRPTLVVVAPTGEESMFGGGPVKALALFVRHELGHVFGIPHLRGRNVMAANPAERSWDYTQISLDVLRANRRIDFGSRSPFAGCDLDVLRDAYTTWDGRGECDPSLLVNLGVALHRERRPVEARAMFEAGLRRMPDSVVARLGLAQTALAAGDSAAARAEADRLTGDEELTAAQRGILGGVWVSLGESARGDSLLTEAVTADSTGFAPWFNRGLARFRMGRLAGARSDFERALAVEERPEGWFNLALVCDASADTAAAIRAFSRYRALVPEGPQSEQAGKFLERLQRGTGNPDRGGGTAGGH
jgi:tetratricopeptide (TPR) repeat protein